MFVNTVLRYIFGTKRENVTGEWLKLHNAEFHDMYSLPNIISDQMKEAVWQKWGRREMLIGFGVGRPEGKRQHLRLKHR
jgi:2-oxoglutarate dehydrogenase complex dehydrogenase (E1) component-like enzyme